MVTGAIVTGLDGYNGFERKPIALWPDAEEIGCAIDWLFAA